MIKVPSNPFSKLSEVIKKYEKDIEYIASGGINRSINYKVMINNFTQLSHIVNHKFLYKNASLSSINRHFLI